MDNQKIIVKEYMLSDDEIKAKFPINSKHNINGQTYRVIEHRSPMSVTCLASYPQVLFELIEE